MKGLLFIVLFFSFAGASFAGDTIFYTVELRHSDCNAANNGSAEITVQQDHPPYTFLWSNGSENSMISGLAPGDYNVTVTDSLGNDTLITLTVQSKECPISAEFVFTPNDDGVNDVWGISNISRYPDHEVLVFNRWGQQVYRSSGDFKGWDGKDLLGKPVPDAAYFYIIYGTKGDDSTIVKGSLNVLR
jgi:gliding motility-associated-like protein